MWASHSTFIVAKAKELHRKFPEVLELDEKISIAWVWADRARKCFKEDKGKFATYSSKVIERGLFRAINKEISSTLVKNKNRKIIAKIYSIETIYPSNDEYSINDKDNLFFQSRYNSLFSKNEMLLDEKVILFNAIKNSRGGFFAWVKEVHGLKIEEISKITGLSKHGVAKAIAKFREKNS